MSFYRVINPNPTSVDLPDLGITVGASITVTLSNQFLVNTLIASSDLESAIIGSVLDVEIDYGTGFQAIPAASYTHRDCLGAYLNVFEITNESNNEDLVDTSDASLLHIHDSRYRTKSELSATTGSGLIGANDTTWSTKFAFDDVQEFIDDLYTWITTSAFTATYVNGFELRNGGSVSFINATRSFSITPSVVDYTYWADSVPYTKTSLESVIIDDVEGLHYIYFNGATLTSTTTWSDEIIKTHAWISTIYWDATNSKQIVFGDERHGYIMATETHNYLHNVFGARLRNGGDIGNILADQNGSNNSHAQFSNGATRFHDEDLGFICDARLSTATIPVYYRIGTSDWRVTESASYPVLTTGSGRAAWNENSGGTWQLTEVTDTKYVLGHVITTHDLDRPFAVVAGIAEYTSSQKAREGVLSEVNVLLRNGLPSIESVFLGTIILQTASAYSNNVKSRIVTTQGEDYIDLRGFVFTRNGTVTSVTEFLGLSDTPSSYVGKGGNFLAVNTAEDGVEFLATVPANVLVLPRNCLITANVGDFVYPDETIDYLVTVAVNNTADPSVIGIIMSKVSPTVANVLLVGVVTGFTGLARGKLVFLGTDGKATTTKPLTGDVQILGKAVSSTEILVNPEAQKVRQAP